MDFDPEITPASPDARYTNYLQVGSAPREIILEFGQYHDGEGAPRIHTRLVTHPDYLEDFLAVLTKALEQRKASQGKTANLPRRDSHE